MALTKVSTGVVDMSGSTGGLVIAKGNGTDVSSGGERPTCNATILGSIRENTDSGVNKVEVCTSTGWQFLEEVGPTKAPLTVDYLVVAGGGGASWGGGGAGGLRTSFGTGNNNGGLQPVGAVLTMSAAVPYTVVVGSEGAAGDGQNTVGGSGASSSFSTITSDGGLGGKSNGQQGDGGKAGGTSVYGFAGGYNNGNSGSGGGGAGAVGAAQSNNTGGSDGGAGLEVNIIGGTGNFYAGGGGGGNRDGSPTGSGGSGGGGDASSSYSANNAQPGTANTGGGGGGASYNNASSWRTARAGGSGVVILRYPSAYTINTTQIGTDLSVTNDNSVSGYTITTIICANPATTGTGTITFA